MTSASIGVRRFVYDPAGRVIGEYGLSAADVKAEFIWLSPEVANDNMFGGDDGVGGYAPLAVATPDCSGTVQLNWVHPNHLGVPLVTTDASGQPATTPNDYLAPGFPGQSRVLADLYYNRYRDYDPTTGRYLQADPIGLAGGGNPYLYAGGNPIGRVDPDGKYWWLIGGAIAGGGFEIGQQALGNWMTGRDVFDPDCYDWAAVGRGALYGAALGGVGRLASLRFAAAERTLVAPASSAAQGARLGEHLGQLEKYGTQGFSKLENGDFHYFGDLKLARAPGEMAETRVAPAWKPGLCQAKLPSARPVC